MIIIKVYIDLIKELSIKKGIDYKLFNVRSVSQANYIIEILQNQSKDFILKEFNQEPKSAKEKEMIERQRKSIQFNKRKKKLRKKKRLNNGNI